MQVKLNAWQGGAAVLVFIVLLLVRSVSSADLTDNQQLLSDLRQRIDPQFAVRQAEQMRLAFDAGDTKKVESLVSTMKTYDGALPITSISVSQPIFEFASTSSAVLRVTYLKGGDKAVTDYFRYQHQLLGNQWRYQHKSGVISYYLNFI